MINLKIKITKQILENSKMCGTNEWQSPSVNCAIAVAVRDIFPRATVTHNEIYFHDHLVSKLPIKAQMFIRVFDHYTPEQRILMPEIEFEISIPDSVIEQINIDELRNHPTLELIKESQK